MSWERNGISRANTSPKVVAMAAMLGLFAPAGVYAQRGGAPAAAPKAAAVVDFTGYWVSVVTNSEQWLIRMATPAKGDYRGMGLTPDGRKLADAWDPAKDEASGDLCKAYGAPAIMQVPGRFHITWEDERTLRIDTDAGKQTRLLHFGKAPETLGDPTKQGYSTAQWDAPGGRGTEGGGAGGLRYAGSSLKVVTTNLRPGYLFKNGVPYGGKALLTEYFNRVEEPDGNSFLVVSEMLEDPQYFTEPFIRPWYFKKIPDAQGWHPTDCTIR
jgi:hypothetical protein